MAEEQFDQTTGSLARMAGVIPDTIRDYANLNLIEYRRLENGVRMFKASAAAQVRAIRQQRLARRGNRSYAEAQ